MLVHIASNYFRGSSQDNPPHTEENCLQTAGRWAQQGAKSVADIPKAGLGYIATNYSEMAEDSVAILRAGTRVFNLYRLSTSEENPLQNEPFDTNHPVNRASVIATQVLGIAVIAGGTCVGIFATPLGVSVGITALSYGASAVYYVAASVFGGGLAGGSLFAVINTVSGVAGYIFAAIPGAGLVVTGLAHMGVKSLFAAAGGAGVTLLARDRLQNIRITACFRRMIDAMIIANGLRQVLSVGMRCAGIFACIYAFSWNLGVAQQLIASGNMMIALKSAAFSIPLAFAAKEIYTTGRELRGSGYQIPVSDILFKLGACATKIAALSATWIAFRWNIWTLQLLLSGSVYKTLLVGGIAVPLALGAYDLHHVSNEARLESNLIRFLWRRGREILRGAWDIAIYDEPSWRPVALDQTYLLRHITGALFLGLNQLRHLARSERPEQAEAPEVGVQDRCLSVSLAAITGLAFFGIPGAMAMTAVEYVRSRQRHYNPVPNIVHPVEQQTGVDPLREEPGLTRGVIVDEETIDVSDSDEDATSQSSELHSSPIFVEDGEVGTAPVKKPSGVLGMLETFIFSHWMADPWMDDEDGS